MKRMVWLVAVLLIFTGLISEMAGAADDPVDQLAQFIFSPNELGEGWVLNKTGKPEEPSAGSMVIFTHSGGSTFYQILLKFKNEEEASKFFADKRDEAKEEAGEDLRDLDKLGNKAYIKPSTGGKPRELVFRNADIVTLYHLYQPGSVSVNLIKWARTQFQKMEKESK